MTIKQGNNEYEIKENDLGLLAKATPLVIKYRILEDEHLGDVDFSILQEYDKKIAEYELVIKQLSEKELSEEDTKYLEDVKQKLEDKISERANDKKAQRKIKLREDLTSLILNELVSDKEVMKKFYSRILIGDISKIDIDDNKFAIEVVTAFFFALQMTKNGYEN